MFVLVPSDMMTRPASQASSVSEMTSTNTREHKLADMYASVEMRSLLQDISREYVTSLTDHNEQRHQQHQQQQQQQWSQRHHDVNNASSLTSLSTDDVGWSADTDNDSSQHSSSRRTCTTPLYVSVTCTCKS